jgi:hypothetical protein
MQILDCWVKLVPSVHLLGLAKPFLYEPSSSDAMLSDSPDHTGICHGMYEAEKQDTASARYGPRSFACAQLDRVTKTHHCIKWEYVHMYIPDCLISSYVEITFGA